MDVVHVILRLGHIVSAFVWVGLALTMVLYIAPASVAAGEGGLRFMKALLTRTPFSAAIAAAGGFTTLFGILLYAISNSAQYFSRPGNMVLGIGALAGLIATIHGGAIVGRATKSFAESLKQNVPDMGAIEADSLATLRKLAMNVGSHSRISLILMIVALIGMGTARYL